MKWQPIETAPKDENTSILGYADGVMTAVRWSPVGDGGYWALCECGALAEDGEWDLTHWMPLPDPPAAGYQQAPR